MVNESYFNERWVLYVINNGLLNSLFSNIDVFSLKKDILSYFKIDLSKISLVEYECMKLDFKLVLQGMEIILKKESHLSFLLKQYGINYSIIKSLKIDLDNRYKLIEENSYNLNEYVYKKQERFLNREEEIERMETILTQFKKSNLIIIGEAGVGKTTLVEILAKKINKNSCKSKLKNKNIRVLEIGRLLEGTKYRGEWEEKIISILDYIKFSKEIIFIDEIHTILNAGNVEGGISAGNILKPYLARGDIQIIGATTAQEYKKYIETDTALARRFQLLYLDELTVEDMKKNIETFTSPYESFHNVKYEKNSINNCIEILHKYLPERKFPDKLLDLIDYSGAKYCDTKKNISDKELKEVLECKINDFKKSRIEVEKG